MARCGRSVWLSSWLRGRVRWGPQFAAPRAWLLYVSLGAPLLLPPLCPSCRHTSLPSLPSPSRARPSFDGGSPAPEPPRLATLATPRPLAPNSRRDCRPSVFRWSGVLFLRDGGRGLLCRFRPPTRRRALAVLRFERSRWSRSKRRSAPPEHARHLSLWSLQARPALRKKSGIAYGSCSFIACRGAAGAFIVLRDKSRPSSAGGFPEPPPACGCRGYRLSFPPSWFYMFKGGFPRPLRGRAAIRGVATGAPPLRSIVGGPPPLLLSPAPYGRAPATVVGGKGHRCPATRGFLSADALPPLRGLGAFAPASVGWRSRSASVAPRAITGARRFLRVAHIAALRPLRPRYARPPPRFSRQGSRTVLRLFKNEIHRLTCYPLSHVLTTVSTFSNNRLRALRSPIRMG